MAITFVLLEMIAELLMRVTVSSDLGGTPTLYWRTNTGWEYEGIETVVTIPLQDGVPLHIDCQDTAFTDDPFPGYATIQPFIDESLDYDELVLQEYTGGDWVTQETQKCDGRGWYLFKTRHLEDVTTHQFRVLGRGAAGNLGTAATLDVFMVRYPDATGDFSYAGGTTSFS